MNELSTSFHSYPKIYALGHRAITELFDGDVVCQEKVDGSQFSFGMIDGRLRWRSKGQEDTDQKMFNKALGTITELAPRLKPGWTYRGEYLASPKHNTIAYARVPRQNIILYDINDGHESYLDPMEVMDEAGELGLEAVPFFSTSHFGLADYQGLLETESCLGGAKVEGIVIKNYLRFGADKKALMGKLVRDDFKEANKIAWKRDGKSAIEKIADSLRTEARWLKAVQHLAERGELAGEPKDIGALFKEVHKDLLDEEADAIKQALFDSHWKEIAGKVAHGLPEWYKGRLAASQFGETA